MSGAGRLLTLPTHMDERGTGILSVVRLGTSTTGDGPRVLIAINTEEDRAGDLGPDPREVTLDPAGARLLFNYLAAFLHGVVDH